MVSLEYRCLKLRKLLGWPDSIELDILRAVFGFCCQNFIKI